MDGVCVQLCLWGLCVSTAVTGVSCISVVILTVLVLSVRRLSGHRLRPVVTLMLQTLLACAELRPCCSAVVMRYSVLLTSVTADNLQVLCHLRA